MALFSTILIKRQFYSLTSKTPLACPWIACYTRPSFSFASESNEGGGIVQWEALHQRRVQEYAGWPCLQLCQTEHGSSNSPPQHTPCSLLGRAGQDLALPVSQYTSKQTFLPPSPSLKPASLVLCVCKVGRCLPQGAEEACWWAPIGQTALSLWFKLQQPCTCGWEISIASVS